jgi:cytochrome b pre-mRNA-processing protein 3
MAFADFFRRSRPHEDAALTLYRSMVEKARDPAFYAALGVPDTVNGRFDMLVIHAMLVLRRLRGGGVLADQTGKAMLELLFRDMDQSLREMGIGDMGVGRHIKKMAKAMFGRADAYEAGLDSGEPGAIAQVLKDNIYRQGAPAEAVVAQMADYMRRADAHTQREDVAEIAAGRINLAVPVLTGGAHVG